MIRDGELYFLVEGFFAIGIGAAIGDERVALLLMAPFGIYLLVRGAWVISNYEGVRDELLANERALKFHPRPTRVGGLAALALGAAVVVAAIASLVDLVG